MKPVIAAAIGAASLIVALVTLFVYVGFWPAVFVVALVAFGLRRT